MRRTALVLKDVSFEMKAGQVIAVVGATGSGKTTIGRLLTRMYDGYEGSIGLVVRSFGPRNELMS